ncbi:MAG: UDP-N-acetylmuramyl-tripeptide synthetase [Candidatus Pacebacteria bacterium]|nr:UDP-N-acetylmuramyl-tripeptide synthetase [Candidatus Paceibacterota bacterium]
MLTLIKRLIPRPVFLLIQPIYHYTLSLLGALIYRFPSNSLYVIGVTGTKGKSSTVQIISSILEASGEKVATASTISFSINDESVPNKFKMTMPGRFFLQYFLRGAVRKGSKYAVIEMTSEGVKQFRHKWIALDALVFTNLRPEHIEAHGSFENYRDATLKLRDSISKSNKKERVIVSNIDDEHGSLFLDTEVEKKLPYSLTNTKHGVNEKGVTISLDENTFTSTLRGKFNGHNILAAITLSKHLGIDDNSIQRGLDNVLIPGRVEFINEGQDFDVVVDYAHTTDSLLALYDAFPGRKKICVLGSTGGGRDKWKRPKIGEIVEANCEKVILTDEDPYDENPKEIVEDVISGMKEKPQVIMDRREAIKKGIEIAEKGGIVLITGKGTDPYIMGPRGEKTPWSDAEVAREILHDLGKTDVL